MSDALDLLLRELRAELRAEAPSVLHSHAAPALRDADGLADRDTDQGGIGPPFTAAFHRYIGHPDHWGTSRLGMASILEVSAWCASRHPTHRRPLFTRALCSELLYQAAHLGQTVADLAWIHGQPPEAVEGMLLNALRHAHDWRIDRFARATREPGHEEPLPERRGMPAA